MLDRYLLALTLAFGPSMATAADTWEYGVTDSKAESYALTTNQSGSIFGQWCDVKSDTCFWLLAVATACEPGTNSPVLINARDGAYQTKMRCSGSIKIGGRTYWRYIFTEFDTIDKLTVGAGIVGFAMPLESGKFLVERFELTGATSAIASSHRRHEELRRTSTRSQSL